MAKFWKRSLSLFMALVMLFSMLPVGALASEPEAEPAVTEPVVTEPVVTEPVVTEPVVTEPVVTEPVVTEPAVTEPVVTEPIVTEPEATEPADYDTLVQETIEVSFEDSDTQETEPAEIEAAEPAYEQLIQGEISVLPAEIPELTDDELFAIYANNLFFPDEVAACGTSGMDTLSGNALAAYNALRPALEAIASGNRSSSEITIGYEITGYDANQNVVSYTPEFSAELTGETFPEAELKQAINALLTDLPYELYWYAKTVETQIGYIGGGGKWFAKLAFPVSANYSVSGTNGYDPNTEKTGAAAATVAKATSIARESVSGLNDYEKLVYFRDYVAGQVSYNYNSGLFKDNSDPWQVIYVFDDDPDTNVVCEGYAKAFKHLCDLAEFEDKSILCETVTGYTSGPHMWNIVRIGGVSYLVDITNADHDSGEIDNSFFLVGASGSIADGYTVTQSNGGTLLYDYSYVSDQGQTIQSSIDTFGAGESSILNLSDTRYYSQQVFEADLVAHAGQNFTMTDSVTITGDVTVNLGDMQYALYIPEGVTLTVASGASLILDAFTFINGGELVVEQGGELIVRMLLCVGQGNVGGTLTAADGAVVTKEGNSTIQLMLNGQSKINGSVPGVMCNVSTQSAEELAEALSADYTGITYVYINVNKDMTLLENLPQNTTVSPENIYIYVQSGYTLTVGSAENNVALTNNHNLYVYPSASLVVADGSTLDNQRLIYSAGSVSGTITGNEVVVDDGNSGSGEATITEESFADDMAAAAESQERIYYRLTNSLELTTVHTIPENVIVDVSPGCTLTVTQSAALTVYGQLQTENGNIVIDGTLVNENIVSLSFTGNAASLTVSENGVFTNNDTFQALNGTVALNGTFTGNATVSTLADVSGNITPDRIRLRTYVDTEEELVAALEKKDGYISQAVNVWQDIVLENSIVIPDGVELFVGGYMLQNLQNPQYALVVPDGVTLTVCGTMDISEVAMLRVESGGRVRNRGTISCNGTYINTGFYVGEPVNNYDSDMNEAYLRQAMSTAVANGKPVFLRDPLVLTEDLEITSGTKFLLDVGGRIEVSEGRTLTVSADTEILGGQLVVHPGGNLILNNSVTCHRGTLYALDGANVDQEHNLGGIITDSSDLNPYLSGYWVHDFGEGYFLNDEQYWETRGMEIVPGSAREHIFYLNVFNDETLSWDQTPLHPGWLNTSEFVSLEQMELWEEFEVKEGEPNSQCFVRIFVADDENAWDQEGYVSYSYEGAELFYAIQHKRSDDMGFYSAPEATNANWLEGFQVNPVADDNSFYFIFHGPSDIATVDSVEIHSEGDRVSMVQQDEKGYVYKLTVNPEAAEQIWVTHGFDVEITVQATYTDGSSYEESRNIYLDPLWLHEMEADAEFGLNGETYRYFAEKDKIATYTENGAAFVELPEGVGVAIQQQEDGTDRLTVTLENAHLNTLLFSYFIFDENGVRDFSHNAMPSDTVNLVLSGNNELVCGFDSALMVCDGATVNICGDGTLLIKTIVEDGNLNEYGMANAWHAVNMWNDGHLAISGSAQVTAEVAGIGHHDNGEQTFLAAMNAGGGSLAVMDSASLTTVLPAGARRSGDALITYEDGNGHYEGGYAGLHEFFSVTVLDEATLTTSQFETKNYSQSGGTVTVNSNGSRYYDDIWQWDEEEQKDVYMGKGDGYHYDGLVLLDNGNFNFSGGELTINLLPTEEEHAVRSYFDGIKVRGGEVEISDTAVLNINTAYDGKAIFLECTYNDDGTWDESNGGTFRMLGGEINFTSQTGEDYPHFIDINPVSYADFVSGTITAEHGTFAIGGSADWKRTVLNASDFVFSMDGQITMSSAELHLTDGSIIFANGGAEIFGSSELYLENSSLVVRGGLALMGDAYLEILEDDDCPNDFALGIYNYFSISENASVNISAELTEQREMTPIYIGGFYNDQGEYVCGCFHQMGGYVSVQQNENCLGAAMKSNGETLIDDGTLDVYGNEIAIIQGYDFNRPADRPSQFDVNGGTVNASSGNIGILAQGPVNLYGGNVNAYAEGVADNETGSWPQAVRVEKFTGQEEPSGENLSSLNIYGGVHSFQAVDTSESEACSKALSLFNAPLNYYGGLVNLSAEMTLYSFSDSLENNNINGDVTISSGMTGETLEIQSREFTESEDVDNDYFHTLLETDGSYVTQAAFLSSMTVETFIEEMANTPEGEVLLVTQQLTIDRQVELTANVCLASGASITVKDGAMLVIPEGVTLFVTKNTALLAEAGGMLLNMGVIHNDFGYVGVEDPEGYAQSGMDSEDEPQAELIVSQGGDVLSEVYNIGTEYQTLRVYYPDETELETYLAGAEGYRKTEVFYNEDLNVWNYLHIAETVTLYYGGNADVYPTLSVDEIAKLSVSGSLITNYANVHIDGQLYPGFSVFNRTEIGVSETGGIFSGEGGAVMLNNGSLMIIQGTVGIKGDLHVGQLKDLDVEGPAGTINIASGGELVNRGNLYIWEEGVVNVNGVLNNFWDQLPNTIGPVGEIQSMIHLEGKMYVQGELNNDTQINIFAENPENGLIVSDNASVWNSETGYIISNGAAFIAEEDSTVVNENLIDVGLGEARILGFYEDTEDSQLITGYEMAEDGTETVNIIEGVPTERQILQLKVIYEYPEPDEEVAEVNFDHVQGLVDATAYHGFQKGYVLTDNAAILIDHSFTVPENISFFIGTSSDVESISDFHVTETGFLTLNGSVALRNGGWFINDGHVHASGANITFDGNNSRVANYADMMLTDGTVISPAANGEYGETFYGTVENKGSLFITGDSRVECSSLENIPYEGAKASVHVGFSGDPNIEVHTGYLSVNNVLENNAYIQIEPSGTMEIMYAQVRNLNNELDCGYFDVQGDLNVKESTFKNFGLITAGHNENSATINVSTSSFYNYASGLVSSYDNGSVTFGAGTTVTNTGLMENITGEMAIHGTYKYNGEGVVTVGYLVDENGAFLNCVEDLENQYVTVLHPVSADYPMHNENTVRDAMAIVSNDGYDGLKVTVQRTDLAINSELQIPANMSVEIGEDDTSNSASVTVNQDAFVYNSGVIAVLSSGSLIVNGGIGQCNELHSNGHILVNEGADLHTMFENAVTVTTENASVVNNGMMSGPAQIQGAYTHGADAVLGGGYVVYEDGTVAVKEAVGPNVTNSIKTLNHSITAEYPAHGEATVRSYLEYVQTNGYAGGSLYILPGSELAVTENLTVSSNVETLVYGTLKLAPGVKYQTENSLTNNGTIHLEANAAVAANAEVTNSGIVQGSCGDSLTWSLENGVLTYTGSGDMINYTNVADIPWNFLANTITEIRFTGNAPAISENAFTGITATAYYPAGDSSWDSVIDKNYGGSITWVAEGEKELFSFYAANVIMGNNMDMMFAIPRNAVTDWTGHYVLVDRSYADGRANDVRMIPFEEWTTNGGYYVVTYKGLAAKEMCDNITLTVHNASGKAVSNPWVDSMRAYVTRQLPKITNNLQKTMMVDMLNYGAAAQSYFGYGADDLANSQLTEEQRGYASTGKEFAHILNQGDQWYASNLILESNIRLLVAFKSLTTDMYATVSYTDHYGKNIVTDISGSEFGKSGSYYYVEIDTLVVSDARQKITITIYNADGSLYTVCEESIEDYLARRSSVSDLFAAIMKFADSAYAYLHRND